MPEPKTLGRVDWMPRLKIWRVIRYKGAADIPAGDYPTKKEAEDALRELVARGNPGDIKVTPEVTMISAKLATIDLPNVKVSGSYATGSATPKSDIDLLIGISNAEWDKVTLYDFPDTIKKLYSTLPEDKMTIHLYKLSEPNKLWHFQRPRVEGGKHFSGVFLPVDYSQEMTQGLWDKAIKPTLIPKASGNPEVVLNRDRRLSRVSYNDAYQAWDVGIFIKEPRYGGGFKYGSRVLRRSFDTKDTAQAWVDEFMSLEYGEVPKEATGGNPMPKTETQRIAFHERIFGKGSIPPLERLRRGQTANELMPMSPEEGPPLPRALGIRWFWKK